MISYNSVNNNLNQSQKRTECVTIGRMAPDFMALSTQGYIKLSDYRGKWVVLGASPSSFGGVYTTEVIDAAQNYDEILKRNAVIIGLTTDNLYSNLAWVYEIYQKTGITIPFPIIADGTLEISALYGMLNPDRMYGETVRDTFIINPFGRITAIITLPVCTGRNAKELIRILDSIQLKEQYNLCTPANWQEGDPVLLPNPTSYEELINRVNNAKENGYLCPFWYLCYTKQPPSSLPNENQNINNI